MLHALLRMHRSEGDPASRLPLEELDLPANYLPKVQKRFHAHKATCLAPLEPEPQPEPQPLTPSPDPNPEP